MTSSNKKKNTSEQPTTQTLTNGITQEVAWTLNRNICFDNITAINEP